jgi:hypothetical protein
MSEWEWAGSAGLALQFMLIGGSKGERKTAHPSWICWIHDRANGPRDHWFWKFCFRERGLT